MELKGVDFILDLGTYTGLPKQLHQVIFQDVDMIWEQLTSTLGPRKHLTRVHCPLRTDEICFKDMLTLSLSHGPDG